MVMENFQFVPRISLGDVVVSFTFLSGLIGLYFRMKGRLDMQDFRLTYIEAAIEDAKDTLKKSDRQEIEVRYLRDKIEELAHGDGWVAKRGKEVDGEYERSRKIRDIP